MNLSMLALAAVLVGVVLWKRKMDIVSITIGAISVFAGWTAFWTLLLVEHGPDFALSQSILYAGISAVVLTIMTIGISEQLR